MIQIDMKVAGMMCGMCEKHVNQAIEQKFQIKQVESSHEAGTTRIKTEQDIPDDALKQAVAEAGYQVTDINRTEKKGLFRK